MTKKKSIVYVLIIITSILIMFFLKNNSCSKLVYHTWKVCHIVHDNEELLHNDIKKNGYRIPLLDSGIMKFSPNEIYYKSHKRNLPRDNFETIKLSLIQKQDECFLKLEHSSRVEFNGFFSISFSNEKIFQDNTSLKEVRMVLKSETTTIYLTRYEAI